MRISISLVDGKGEKSVLDVTGGPESLEAEIEKVRRTFAKTHRIVGYTVVLDDGSTGQMSKGEPCLGCGRMSSSVFRKVERNPEGIAIARTEVPLCHRDMTRFTEDRAYREKMWSMGLQMHLAAEPPTD